MFMICVVVCLNMFMICGSGLFVYVYDMCSGLSGYVYDMWQWSVWICLYVVVVVCLDNYCYPLYNMYK
jgi:hypothetical protein